MKVKITVTALTNRCDGYAEIMLGSMLMAGLLQERPKLTKTIEGDETTIIIRGNMGIPPLGHMGEIDIEDES